MHVIENKKITFCFKIYQLAESKRERFEESGWFVCRKKSDKNSLINFRMNEA